MSVLVTLRFKGDTSGIPAGTPGTGRRVRGDHRRVPQSQQFFAGPALQAFIGTAGAAPEPPEMTLAEAATSPGQF